MVGECHLGLVYGPLGIPALRSSSFTSWVSGPKARRNEWLAPEEISELAKVELLALLFAFVIIVDYENGHINDYGDDYNDGNNGVN